MVKSKELILPSIRARMGDWWYYVTTMTFGDVKSRVVRADQIHERKELKTWIQRTITPKRLEQIATYLMTQEQRFFNGIIAGMYKGSPDWYPVEIGESQLIDDAKLDKRTKYSIGLLKLSGSEEIFAIDGQHRVEAIKEAVRLKPKLKAEEQCIIFVAHKETTIGRERTRRLFSTLNKKAVRVSQGELVALDEDDTFAIVVRNLVDKYKPLNEKFVPLTANTNIPNNNDTCITTVLGLYNLVQIIECSKDRNGSIKRKTLSETPANKKEINNIYKRHIGFWEIMKKHIPEIKEVTDSIPSKHIASKYRTENGGHILFRPIGQKAFANAVRIMMDRGISMDDAVNDLSKTPLQFTSKPWTGVLWNPTAQTIIPKYSILAQNLLLYMVRQEIPPISKRQKYPLEKIYREALNDTSAQISSIPQIPASKLKGIKNENQETEPNT